MVTDVEQRADQANQVLENPVFQEAYDMVIEGLVEAIGDAPIEDANMRNQLGLQLGAAKQFQANLLEYIVTGKLEADQAKDESLPTLNEEDR